MGFYLIGIEPKNTKGDYLNFSIWTWGPLWSYCEAVAPAICVQVESPRTNNGEKVSAENSEALGEALEKELASGRTKEYVEGKRNADEEALDTALILKKAFGIKDQDTNILTEEDVRVFAQFLKNCGGFEIW